MPDLTEKGGQSVSSGSKVANHNETPTDKTSPGESPLGDFRTPYFLGERRGSKFPKKKHQQTESNLARRKRSQRYFLLPPVAPFCVDCQPEGIA